MDHQKLTGCLCVVGAFLLSSWLPSFSHAQSGTDPYTYSKQEAQVIDLLKKAEELLYSNPDSAGLLYTEADRLCSTIHSDSLHIHTLTTWARWCMRAGQHQDALEQIRRAMRIAQKAGIENHAPHYYSQAGQCFENMNQMDSALHYFLKWDHYNSTPDRHHKRHLSQAAFARIYFNQGDRERADKHLNEALTLCRIKKTPTPYLYLLYNSIGYYEEWGDFEKSAALRDEYIQFKLQQGAKPGKELTIPAHANMDMPGRQRMDQLKLLQVYLPIHRKNENWISLTQGLYELGHIYLESDQPQNAIDAFSEGAQIAQTIVPRNILLNMHQGLFEGYQAVGNYKESLVHLQAAFDLREEIRDADRQLQINELMVQYETEKKQHELESTQFALTTARQRQMALAIGAAALALLSGLALFAFINKRRLSRQLEEKNRMISKTLEQKDILLREIHHRVKNNLQMISSLLYLQGKSITDPTAREAIKESENRVQSMAMIHQNLYQDENLLGVEVRTYLDKLLDHLFSSYNIDPERIRLEKHIEHVHLDVDTVIPLALIVNELVSNALKHAFKDGRRGEVRVNLFEESGQLRLSVEDNGMGIPLQDNSDVSGSFGYKLIEILLERLKAKMEFDTSEGTRITLSLPGIAA